MPEYTEREIKLLVPDLDSVRSRLDELDAELESGRVFERNVRYENADQTLTQQQIVVRLRQDTRTKLTYKAPQQQVAGEMFSRFEVEVEVSDFDAMDLILKHLGYEPYLIYEKYRTTYGLNDAEILLDEMPYGSFVEIEGTTGAIRSALESLNLTDATRYDSVNYIAIFNRVKAYLGLDVDHLTFENFQDITVPQEAFGPGDP